MNKRLDKFLCDRNIGTRSQVKNLIQKGQITVNGEVVKKPEIKVTENDIICFGGNELSNEEFVYYMFHKPGGIITATEDKRQTTVLDYFKELPCKDLYPVGRLDKDTEGLLLITNDGELGHHLLSPRHHIPKTYFTVLEKEISDLDIVKLEKGVDIGEKNPTLPAKVERMEEKTVLITITEGKFHQIKRMFETVDNKVVYLKRVSMGGILLDEKLKPGEFRRLTDEEICYLKNL